MQGELDVLRKLTLGIYQPPKEIWENGVVVVESLHRAELENVRGKIRQLREGTQHNIVLLGRPGAGKSHFLGRVRRTVVAAGDLFVAVHLTNVREFWRGLVGGYLDAFGRQTDLGVTQLQSLLHTLLTGMKVAEERALPLVASEVTEEALKALKPKWATLWMRTHIASGIDLSERTLCDVAQALVLFNSQDFEHRDIAEALCQGLPVDPADARRAMLRTAANADGDVVIDPRQVVKAFDVLVMLSGHTTVLAVDQLDGLIANAQRSEADGGQSELDGISNGLMDLAQDTQNTLVVLSCTPDSWGLIKAKSIKAVAARFPVNERLGNLPSAAAGQDLIEGLLAPQYEKLGFAPPYPTWPVRPSAFAEADDLTPRLMIQAVLDHINACLRAGRVSEMVDPPYAGETAPAPPDDTPPPSTGSVDAVERRFAALKGEARTDELLTADGMDDLVPPLLYDGLSAWSVENAHRGSFSVDPIADAKRSVHARLRQVVDAAREDEVHWAFRLLGASNHVAQQSRLQKAVSAVGLGPRRHLVVVRNAPWNSGPKTRKVVEAFEAAGGRTVPLGADDAATLFALHRLIAERPDPAALAAWQKAARPASGLAIFAALSPETVDGAAPGRDAPIVPRRPAPAEPAPVVGAAGRSTPDEGRAPPAGTSPMGRSRNGRPPTGMREPPSEAGTFAIGRGPNGSALRIRLEDLRRHTCIFAGSGSGKTVLIRRIVEECALEGVSSIVLDPNNDLARLGTPWPAPPPGWGAGDAQKAARYFATVETVVWTPRITGGRPLAFAPLAGLAAVAGDPDEFAMAIDNAVALLAPRSGLPLSGAKGERGRAVLREAIAAYVRHGGDRLGGFLGYLNALPEGVSRLDNADKLAAEMAQTLLAQSVNDPLFGDRGQAADPAVLLTPQPGKAARVSVISLAGLPSDDQRQNFVSQLQMALFSFVKKNPAGERPLGGLLVMDEAQIFAPSGAHTPSSETTLSLASQARKYGLGLIFATQAPKGLHNRIAGNATTQIFGLLNASAQIEAAKELAAAKGGAMPEISRLRAGEFYIASEGLAFERLNAPMCLSYHPKSPLSHSQIVALASA